MPIPQHTAPRTTVFKIADRPVSRYGPYAKILEQLKELHPKGEGLVIEFPSKSAGSAAIQRLALMGAEDGWDVFQQLTGKDASRYVWAAPTEE